MEAARFDSGGGAAADGVPSTAAWLRARTTATHAEAAALVRVGRELRDRLPNTAAALRCGELGWDGARTIAKGLRNVHDRAVLGEADAILAAHAPRLAQHELTYLVRETLQRIDPVTAQRDARQRWEDRELTLSPMLDGAVALRGQLDEHGAAVLQSALAPLIKPLGPGDARTARQRRADALVELIAKAAADGHAGVENTAGLPPTLVVHVDVEQLAAPAAEHDAGSAAGDRRQGCCGASPRPGGVVADLDWGGPILRESLERIGCTAQLVRLVTAGGSRVLDVGTAQRLATPAQRIALAARDKGCAFPGCDRPPGWTDAHHLVPWRTGGRTDLDNLILLCRHHHRLVHEGGWTASRRDDRVEYRDPNGLLHGSTPMPRIRGG
jgi:hypothetical protein